MNPPRLVLSVGGTSTLKPAMPGKLKSPHFKHKSGGGSRWPDPTVFFIIENPSY